MSQIWDEIGALVDTLPGEEQERYRQALRDWTHELRGSLGVVFSAVGLLERRYKADNVELFLAMRNGMKQTLVLIEDIRSIYDK
jgi:signal transduction histidine kinase